MSNEAGGAQGKTPPDQEFQATATLFNCSNCLRLWKSLYRVYQSVKQKWYKTDNMKGKKIKNLDNLSE